MLFCELVFFWAFLLLWNYHTGRSELHIEGTTQFRLTIVSLIVLKILYPSCISLRFHLKLKYGMPHMLLILFSYSLVCLLNVVEEKICIHLNLNSRIILSHMKINGLTLFWWYCGVFRNKFTLSLTLPKKQLFNQLGRLFITYAK